MSQKRVFCHTQRMGALNSLALAKDQVTVLTVGQEKRLTYWDVAESNPQQMFAVDGELDEARSVVM